MVLPFLDAFYAPFCRRPLYPQDVVTVYQQGQAYTRPNPYL
jgi:hypothetical protein